MISFYQRFIIAALWCVSALCIHTAKAQTISDTLDLPEIEVTATRIQQPLQLQPTNIQVIDSTLLRLQTLQNMGEVLNNSSTLFIKDNGPGGMATASQRGLSSEQIQVLWEGFPINNLMLGLTDFSLLPVSMFSSMQLSSGNPSSAFGGGSMSGAVYLSSDFDNSDRIAYRQGIGSFGQWQSALNGQYQSGHWHAGLRSVVSRADNDFEYYNDAYDRYEHREHNRQEQENVMATVGYSSGVKQFETKFWIQNSNNQIPGSVLETRSQARQDDQALRWLSSYQTRWQDINITLKSYLDRVELNYFDPKIDTRSLSTFRRWLNSVAFDYKISEHALLKGDISGGLSGAESNNYADLKTRQQFSALINPELSVLNHRLKIYPALRFDSYSDFGSVLSPSLGLNYELLFDKLYLRGQTSQDFNPPTFNALYWSPGGVSTLDAERGNSAEAGVVYNPRWGTFSGIKLTAFYNAVNDGIRWYRNESGNHSPQNVDEITSKGLEASLKNRLVLPGQWKLQLRQAANYIDATITEPRFPGDAGVGNQLRYIPRWTYQSSLQINKGIVTGFVQYRFTSRRYYSETESLSSSLDPYHILNATLQLNQQWAGINFAASAGVRNLLDSEYEIVNWYAMPKRNYQFSLTATYQF